MLEFLSAGNNKETPIFLGICASTRCVYEEVVSASFSSLFSPPLFPKRTITRTYCNLPVIDHEGQKHASKLDNDTKQLDNKCKRLQVVPYRTVYVRIYNTRTLMLRNMKPVALLQTLYFLSTKLQRELRFQLSCQLRMLRHQ